MDKIIGKAFAKGGVQIFPSTAHPQSINPCVNLVHPVQNPPIAGSGMNGMRLLCNQPTFDTNIPLRICRLLFSKAFWNHEERKRAKRTPPFVFGSFFSFAPSRQSLELRQRRLGYDAFPRCATGISDSRVRWCFGSNLEKMSVRISTRKRFFGQDWVTRPTFLFP